MFYVFRGRRAKWTEPGPRGHAATIVNAMPWDRGTTVHSAVPLLIGYQFRAQTAALVREPVRTALAAATPARCTSAGPESCLPESSTAKRSRNRPLKWGGTVFAIAARPARRRALEFSVGEMDRLPASRPAGDGRARLRWKGAGYGRRRRLPSPARKAAQAAGKGRIDLIAMACPTG
jgi:hypothetical protein